VNLPIKQSSVRPIIIPWYSLIGAEWLCTFQEQIIPIRC